MRADMIHDYVDDQTQESGLDVAAVLESQNGSEERVATFVDIYTELGYLFIETREADMDWIKEAFDALKEEGIDVYEMVEIKRVVNGVTLQEHSDWVRVIDRSENRVFDTRSSSNPEELEQDEGDSQDSLE